MGGQSSWANGYSSRAISLRKRGLVEGIFRMWRTIMQGFGADGETRTLMGFPAALIINNINADAANLKADASHLISLSK